MFIYTKIEGVDQICGVDRNSATPEIFSHGDIWSKNIVARKRVGVRREKPIFQRPSPSSSAMQSVSWSAVGSNRRVVSVIVNLLR